VAQPDAFDEFYLASRDRLVVQLAALTGDPVEALDHVQEAFVTAWTRWDQIRQYDDPEGWVRRVAYHHAVSRWRRARRVVLGASTSVDEHRIQLDPDQRSVIEALGGLRRHEREVLVLHHLAGYSVEEIARQLGRPTGTVKSWLSRGRDRLAQAMSPHEDEVAHDHR
jgi:RNA polymerase sigma-70 factor, ECF subfamily